MKRNDDGRSAVEGDGKGQSEEQPAKLESLPDETWHWDMEVPLPDDREFLYEDERWSRDD